MALHSFPVSLGHTYPSWLPEKIVVIYMNSRLWHTKTTWSCKCNTDKIQTWTEYISLALLLSGRLCSAGFLISIRCTHTATQPLL